MEVAQTVDRAPFEAATRVAIARAAIVGLAALALAGCAKSYAAPSVSKPPQLPVIGAAGSCTVYAMQAGGGVVFVTESSSASYVCSVAAR